MRPTTKIPLICRLVRFTDLHTNLLGLGNEYLCKINLFECCLSTVMRKFCAPRKQKRIDLAFYYPVFHQMHVTLVCKTYRGLREQFLVPVLTKATVPSPLPGAPLLQCKLSCCCLLA